MKPDKDDSAEGRFIIWCQRMDNFGIPGFPRTGGVTLRAAWLEADRQRAAVYKEDDEPLRGDNEPCYYCKSPCSSFAGNPALWPVCLASPEIPGKAEWFHAGCVQSRLRQNEEAIQKAVRETAQRCLVIAFENAGFNPNRVIARIECEFLSAQPEKTKGDK